MRPANPLGGWRIRSRLMRHFELRENNANWRQGSACLKWCPVQSSSDCTTDELPDAYEPPIVEEVVEDNALVESTTQGIIAAVTEVEEIEAPVQSEDQPLVEPVVDPLVEPNSTAEPEVTGGESAPENESEVVNVPVEQKYSFGPRKIIKVPCNGNAKPDRSGVCRSVW